MGKVLIEQSPLFRLVLRECENVLASLDDKPAWSIIDEISKTGEDSNIYKSAYSQPLCTALQLGLVVLWRSWGVSPTAVIGHSSGEIAAAHAAGIISLEHAIIIAYYRGLYLSSSVPNLSNSEPRGSMCAVGMSEVDANTFVEEYLDQVQLAAVNSPSNCTFSGDRDAIRNIVEKCAQNGTFCRELRVDMGKHSIFHMMLCLSTDALCQLIIRTMCCQRRLGMRKHSQLRECYLWRQSQLVICSRL